MSVLVTVGTTRFDELVLEADKQEFHDELLINGYSKLKIQYGRGEYKPTEKRVKCSKNPSLKTELEITCESYINEIKYGSYDLVICHAGAGSILNSLRSNRRTIVVVNNKLMDNHQSELAFQLHHDKNLIAIDYPNHLTKYVKVATETADLVPFPNPDNSLFKELINSIVKKDVWK